MVDALSSKVGCRQPRWRCRRRRSSPSPRPDPAASARRCSRLGSSVTTPRARRSRLGGWRDEPELSLLPHCERDGLELAGERELTRADVVPMQRAQRCPAHWRFAGSSQRAPRRHHLGPPTFVRRQAPSAVSGSPNGHEILGWPEAAPIRGRVFSAWSRTWSGARRRETSGSPRGSGSPSCPGP